MLEQLILPIIIGVVAAYFLLSILFVKKQSFSDLGALTQLQTSRPVYYPAFYYTDEPIVYNNYPKNPLPTNEQNSSNYVLPYPYPYPFMIYPATDMNKVKGIENHI